MQASDTGTSPDAPHRVLLISANLRAGGMERQVALLANALAQRADYEVTVFLLDGNAPIAYPLTAEVQLRHSGAAGYAGLLRSLWMLPAMARRQALTLSFLDLGNLVAQLTRRGPLIWNLATSGVPAKRTSRLIHSLARRCSSRIELAIGNDQRVVDFYQGAGFRCRRFAVIPNGLDTRRFRPRPETRSALRRELDIPENVLLLGAVARSHPDKRHDLLLDLLLARPDTHLLCIGDRIADDPGLREQISRRNLTHRVTCLNAKTDIERLLPVVDIGCCVSDREGLPNSLLELMATGIPCLGTRVGGLPDLLDGVGQLVNPGSLESLLVAFDALRDPTEREQLGARGRQRVIERYAAEAILERWLLVLQPFLVRARS